MKEFININRIKLLDVIKNKYSLDIEGGLQTEIPALDFYFSHKETEFNTTAYEPSLCIILQGSKAIDFGKNPLGYNIEKYLLSAANLFAKVKILDATKEEPYVSLRIKFRLEDIYEVIKNLDNKKFQLSKKTEKGLFFDNLNERLYDPVVRLVKLLEQPKEEIEFLSPMIIKEILFILIKDESGYFLNKFAMEGTISNKIVKVVSQIKDNFNKKLNVKELARLIDMSESSLYENFKTITSMSPIQFQKKIRLEEAKLMLLNQNIEASEVAFAVGYESPSQFSREYSRMYGMSPKAHAEFLKKNR
ncbi:AraC family transcriptional regulator [Halarcobacter sp.]|uniref:AraC family transcriptional regulator n=1 Tax=Halarcobacter sp. TaxID=2321133 RepID=UPI002AAC0796|nr:AraC family transcriptional regulator [Halarcobacter sp.]